MDFAVRVPTSAGEVMPEWCEAQQNNNNKKHVLSLPSFIKCIKTCIVSASYFDKVCKSLRNLRRGGENDDESLVFDLKLDVRIEM